MKPMLLIDAYNVIRHNIALARFEEEKGTDQTVAHFVALCKAAILPDEFWVIVFDGPGLPFNEQADGATIEVFFSYENKADDLILDKARMAKLQNRPATIASTDFELHEPGVDKVSAFDFYDMLVARPALKVAQNQESEICVGARMIFGALTAAGHLPRGFTPDSALAEDLDAIFDYYADNLHTKANKAAAKVLEVLTTSCRLTPDPDPEKQILRAIKAVIRQSCEMG